MPFLLQVKHCAVLIVAALWVSTLVGSRNLSFCPGFAEIDLQSLWLNVSHDASLGDFLFAPVCPYRKQLNGCAPFYCQDIKLTRMLRKTKVLPELEIEPGTPGQKPSALSTISYYCFNPHNHTPSSGKRLITDAGSRHLAHRIFRKLSLFTQQGMGTRLSSVLESVRAVSYTIAGPSWLSNSHSPPPHSLWLWDNLRKNR